MTVCFERRPSGEIQLFAHPKRGKVDRLPGPLAESLPMRLKCTSGGALPLDTVHGKEIGMALCGLVPRPETAPGNEARHYATAEFDSFLDSLYDPSKRVVLGSWWALIHSIAHFIHSNPPPYS